jgi:hypothetical protein
MQDVQEPHMQPLQEDLRQMSGDMLHAAHGGKDNHAESAALRTQIVLDMQADLGLANNSFVTIVLLEDIMVTKNIF